MNFTEAFEEMVRGEKVRRPSYKKGQYIYLDGDADVLRDNSGLGEWAMFGTDFKATDWEIYHPKPTLNQCHCGFSDIVICEEEVDGKVMFYAQCSECGMRTGYTYDEEWAARIWNDAHPIAEPITEKKQTNFEKYITAELLESAFNKCD